MSFLLNSTCDHWFGNLFGKEPFKRKFDYYYLCVLLGLAARQKAPPGDDAREFVSEFIAAYRPYQKQLIGLLVMAHLDDLGIKADEKRAVSEQIGKLVTSERSSQLTDEGFRLLNSYWRGGFRLLEQEFERPNNTVYFLQQYHKLLDEHLRKNPVFAELLAAAESEVKI